jgi:hypothetical protein
MELLQDIRSAASDPARLEELYRTALRENREHDFAAGITACHRETPDNVLFAAWFYRLQPTQSQGPIRRLGPNWVTAILLSVVGALCTWLLANPVVMSATSRAPWELYAVVLVQAALAIAYLAVTAHKDRQRALLAVLGLAGVFAYVYGFTRQPFDDPNSMAGQYAILMLLHVPLAAWIAVGLTLLGLRRSDVQRFAFLNKSIEVFITGGVFAAGAGVFSVITMGLFAALSVRLSDSVFRLLTAGVGGAVPVLAVAAVYDPRLRPAEQAFEQGLGRLLSMLMRLLLPLTVVVLAIYAAFIPFNFMVPFRQREILMVYNAMLFAVMGLLIGAIPVREEDVPARLQNALRVGVLVLAILAAVVSVYALAAVVYRTVQGMLTPNRLTVIGWNSINIGILVVLIVGQLKRGAAGGMRRLHAAFSIGAAAYIAWTVCVILALPWLFR